ncbi:MAG: hypothetical protein ACRC6H_01710, partial [Culicoidibacterales bacterium]
LEIHPTVMSSKFRGDNKITIENIVALNFKKLDETSESINDEYLECFACLNKNKIITLINILSKTLQTHQKHILNLN